MTDLVDESKLPFTAYVFVFTCHLFEFIMRAGLELSKDGRLVASDPSKTGAHTSSQISFLLFAPVFMFDIVGIAGSFFPID